MQTTATVTQAKKYNSPPTPFIIRQAVGATDLAAVRACFNAYTTWLDEDIAFQNYAAELDGLPGKYAAPSGALLLAVDTSTDSILGCVAMRPLEPEPDFLLHRRTDARYCEFKRLFVYPEARGRQVSRALVREAVSRAEKAGYHEVLLDTMKKMQAAVNLYVSEGFERTAPYNFSPLDGTMYFTKRLR